MLHGRLILWKYGPAISSNLVRKRLQGQRVLLSRYKLLLLISICLNYSVVSAQPLFTERLVRLDEDESSIQLDGFLDEAVWKEIPAFDGMRVINPDTLA